MSDPRDPKPDLDEPDALLDSLLRDPFPGGTQPNSPTMRPLPAASLANDDVTLVGRGIEELLAQSFSDSGPPGEDPSPVPPPVAVTARPAPPTIPRPVAPPRPVVAPRPRSVSDLLPNRKTEQPPRSERKAPLETRPAPAPIPAPVVETPTKNTSKPPPLPKTAFPVDSPGFEEEETRVLRLPTELSEAPSGAAQPSSGSASERGPGSSAPTRPPATGAAETRVPLAPRLPSLASANVEARAATPTLSEFPDNRLSSIPAAPSIPPVAGPIDPIAREGWIARAEWFELEAHSKTDPQTKARTLLVASELWALVGDIERAREVATEASAIARGQTLINRQQRWLAAIDSDDRSVASLLELESRNAPTAESRLHAAYLGAEVQRLKLEDRDAAKKKFDACARLAPEDARAHVMRLAEQLAVSPAPPKARLPEAAELEPLAKVVEALARHRNPESAEGSPIGALEQLRLGLRRGDRDGSAKALAELSELPELTRSARWLRAALLAPAAATRTDARRAIEQLLEERDSVSARRALSARAVESGDRESLSHALSAGDAWNPVDRAVLSLLSAGPSSLSATDLDALLLSAPPALTCAALLAGAPFGGDGPECGATEARALFRLGQSLARSPREASERLDYLTFALAAFSEVHPSHPLTEVLGLETCLLSGDASLLAIRLSEWPRDLQNAALSRDAEAISALFFELSGNAELARSAYERALLSVPNSEFATRAQIALEPAAASELLERLADSEASGTTSALHFLEAALRRPEASTNAFDALLEKATLADPRLALSYRIGELHARAQGDTERLLSYLRARRQIASDPLELSLDLVREALLRAGSDAEQAATLLREAIEASPSDATLWELLERLSGASDFDRAGWRYAAAQRSQGATRARLLLEAAWEYERTGQRELAVLSAREANATRPSPLAQLTYERLVPGTPQATELAEELLGRAKTAESPQLQRELYRRLAELDEARGDHASALLFQTLIVEQSPTDLPALRRLEAAYLASGSNDDLEGVEAALARALSGADSAAAAQLAARFRLLRGDWADVRSLAELALSQVPNTLWALRTVSAHARVGDQPEPLLDADSRLITWAQRPLDQASLALRAAESAARLERWDQAQRELERALDQVPDHLVALTTLAEVLESRSDLAGAARAWEAVAEASGVDAHRVAALYRAAVLWLDRVGNPEPGRLALEQAVGLDLRHEDAVARLQALYVARGDRQRLAELLTRRLEHTTDPEERIAIEVTRGRALAEVGEPAAARAALTAALDANPDHLDALEAFSELCLSEGDWLGAEQAFIRLARHSSEPARQAQVYRKLGELYDTSIPNPERAELAYQEVLRRDPNDDQAVDRLVAVYARLNSPTRALEVQSQLLARATNNEQRRDRIIRLATVYEQVASDPKQAEQTLERARKEWPLDAAVLRAQVELSQRRGETRAANILLDRASADARRALGTGRFEPALFEMLAAVSDLRGNSDSAAVAHATLAALNGEDQGVSGLGPAAGDPKLDDLLAPDLLTPALRALLKRTGEIIDSAYPIDPRALRTVPLPGESSAYLGHVQDVARSFGFPNIHVLLSPALGTQCLPASSSPPVLVFGQALLESNDDAARYSLLVRALKVLQARGAALARTAPIDLWPIFAALLQSLAPSFTPQAVDGKKLSEARARLGSVMRSDQDAELPTLALEVSAQIGNRGTQISTALYQWGTRTALVAVGDPAATFRAIALGAATHLPPSGPERVKWIVRNAEARDVAIFSVSEGYAEARRRLRAT